MPPVTECCCTLRAEMLSALPFLSGRARALKSGGKPLVLRRRRAGEGRGSGHHGGARASPGAAARTLSILGLDATSRGKKPRFTQPPRRLGWLLGACGSTREAFCTSSESKALCVVPGARCGTRYCALHILVGRISATVTEGHL